VRQSKILPIVLWEQDYSRLERLARAEERDPLQQARWILKQVLRSPEGGANAATESAELATRQ
jgi:hypothetical protein